MISRMVRAVVLCSTLVVTLESVHAQTNVLRWHEGLESGVATARESGKPLFVVLRCVR